VAVEEADLTIGDLARQTGVAVKTIRFYSDAGLLVPAARTAARYRLYRPGDRVRLEQIRILRELGFGLDAIGELLGRATDPRAVVDAQLRAIERERSHLARAAAVLRAALAGGDPAGATLRVGAVLRLAAWQRSAALRETLAAPFRGTAVDRGFLDRLLDGAFADIPEQLDDDQWAAFVELVALVTDPSFGAALAAQSDPFWKKLRGWDQAAWQRDFGRLLTAGVAALAAGTAPGYPRARALADRYVAMLARALHRRPSPAVIRQALAGADAQDPRAERFWHLVAALHKRPPPPHGAVMRLVFDTLRLGLSPSRVSAERRGRRRGERRRTPRVRTAR
jgi:DNA-binding transcriptional MerR regulator